MAGEQDVEFESYLAGKQASKQYESDQAFEAYVNEMKQGGSIKRTPYESSGVGAAVGATAAGVGATVLGHPELAPVASVGGAVVGEGVEQGVRSLMGDQPTAQESAVGFGEQGVIGVAAEVGAGAIRFIKPIKYAEPRLLTPE